MKADYVDWVDAAECADGRKYMNDTVINVSYFSILKEIYNEEQLSTIVHSLI